jgi:(1->4)-alpha-D-glucan 1-alpha-D-glucosylmutase
VPDFYQGTELWDLSLVDPDNRRAVDFAARARALSSLTEPPDLLALAAAWPNAGIKLALIRALLGLRQRLPGVFAEGTYRPIEVVGPDASNVIAFARTAGRQAAIVAVGRHFGRATDAGRRWPRELGWDAALRLADFSDIRGLLAPTEHPSGEVALSGLFGPLPVVVLQAAGRAPTTRSSRRGSTLVPASG